MLPPRQDCEWRPLIHDATEDIDKGHDLAPLARNLCPPRRVPPVVIVVLRWRGLDLTACVAAHFFFLASALSKV